MEPTTFRDKLSAFRKAVAAAKADHEHFMAHFGIDGTYNKLSSDALRAFRAACLAFWIDPDRWTQKDYDARIRLKEAIERTAKVWEYSDRAILHD